MRTFIATIAFLAAVIAEVRSLECQQCISLEEDSCSGLPDSCPTPASDTAGVPKCIQGLENNTLGTHVILTSFRGCTDPSKPDPCGWDISMTATLNSVRLTSKCCTTDLCNNDPITVPSLNTTLNGYKCKECFIEGSSDDCEVEEEILCMGNQGECFNFKGTANRPGEPIKPFRFQGCITTGACEIVKFLPGSKGINYDFDCKEAMEV